jgi:hypothetical protein
LYPFTNFNGLSIFFGQNGSFFDAFSAYSKKQRNIMKANINSTSSTLPTEHALNIRNVLKLIGMKEVATNVFSLPAKNK